MSLLRPSLFLAVMLLVAPAQLMAADAAGQKSKPVAKPVAQSSEGLAPGEPVPISTELLEKAEKQDEIMDSGDTREIIMELPASAAHGIRERIRQRGVFADQACVRKKGEVAECYCAAHLAIPVFSKRVYTTAARRLNYNVWEYADDVLDENYCPAEFDARRTAEPEAFKDTARLAFFQHIEVPVYNKDYVSLVYNNYEREGRDAPVEVKYGILVNIKSKRPVLLSEILGAKQDAALSSFVNAALHKQDAKADKVTFDQGTSEDVDAFYLAPTGLVLQFAPGSVSENDHTLAVTLPASMIAQPELRQLIQPQG